MEKRNYEIVEYNNKKYVIMHINSKNGTILCINNYENIDMIKNHGWYMINNYVTRSVKTDEEEITIKLYIHREIMRKLCGDNIDNLTIDHINRIKHDNRIENLRTATQSLQNSNRNQVERIVKLPDNSGLTNDLLPKHVSYICPRGNHGNGFCVEVSIGEINFKMQTTRDRTISLIGKLYHSVRILEELKVIKPELNELICFGNYYSDILIKLTKEYNEIIKLSNAKSKIIKQNIVTINKNYLFDKIKNLVSERDKNVIERKMTRTIQKINEKFGILPSMNILDGNEDDEDDESNFKTIKYFIKNNKKIKKIISRVITCKRKGVRHLPDNLTGIIECMIPPNVQYIPATDKRGDGFKYEDRNLKLIPTREFSTTREKYMTPNDVLYGTVYKYVYMLLAYDIIHNLEKNGLTRDTY